MTRTFRNSIYIDPLTGLPNFFKFLETDVNTLFEDKGSIIILDIVKFSTVNKKYGRNQGDSCIKSLADLIVNAVKDYEKAFIFRTDGDEFTIILPEIAEVDAKLISSYIRTSFKSAMIKQGLLDSEINVHNLTLSYTGRIFSINQIYSMVLRHSMEKIKYREVKGYEEHWLDHIIGSFTHRITETLSFFNQAYNLAITDDVSGLKNHRAARNYLTNLMEECRISKSEFSILFIDGDNLKRYNKLGYETGNKMIRELSNVIGGSLRESDIIFRWLSGDEFLVVLENTNYSNAIEVAERIRDEVEKQSTAWAIPVTVSIGLSNYPEDGQDIDMLVGKAEKANSYAKDSGKNRVVKWNIENCG